MERRIYIIEDAVIFNKNFAGREYPNNNAGDRNFCVRIDDSEEAQRLANEGWNIKISRPRDEEDEPSHFVPVAVRFDRHPPMIIMITTTGRRVQLTEDTVSLLDDARIEHVDLSINPYHWERNGNSGIKAYLEEMYVTIRESRLAQKYRDESELPFVE